jgi:hypothetical protein
MEHANKYTKKNIHTYIRTYMNQEIEIKHLEKTHKWPVDKRQ